MIVQRSIWRAKRGSVREFREAMAAEMEAIKPPHGFRTLTPAYSGSGEVTIYEFEFDDVAEYDAFWAEWGRTRGDAFFAEVDPLAEGFTFELLRVRD